MGKWIVPLVVIGILAVVIGLGFMFFTSVYNNDRGLHNQEKAQTKANAICYDKMWKTLKQKGGVTEKSADKFAEIYTKIADAKYNDENLLVKFITEENPSYDMSLFKDLSLAVEALQAEFAGVQTKLVDIDREHNDLLTKIPTNFVLMIIGDKPFELKIVTSTRTENAFETGKDDDVKIFEDKAPEVKPQSSIGSNTQNVAENLNKLSKIPVMAIPSVSKK